ncbi:MAG: ATP-binding cassette domain-containing protein [Desulfovibrionaceae bacterium]|nr:ATP-binding cassette domain-containing protein [Desulfovibrionaceae bacterium]MCL2124342.1 ATP-binding cassette domain-containing protein [Desulfovibrionaceae bacterium]
MSERALLRLSDLSRTFRVRRGLFAPPSPLHAVHGVSLDLYKGQSLGLVGESGCGKSTLARMLVGLLAPSSGSMEFDGLPVRERTALYGRVQMVFQDPFSSLNPRMRVGASVGEPLAIRGMAGAQLRERVEENFRLVGLAAEQMRLFPHEFSGGQRQRIAVARALITRPDVLVCDEPVSALDASVQAQVLNLLRDVQESFGLSLLFISHALHVVAFMCRRIAVMYLGRIVELAPRDELFQQAAHPYSQALIEAMPSHSRTRGLPPVLRGEPPSPLHPPAGCAFHPRCAKAMPLCRDKAPELTDLGGGRLARCHLY